MPSILRGVVRALITLSLTATLATAAVADPLPAPEGRVILVVSGAIGNTNGDGKARFDRAMLEAMATSNLATTTPWTKGVQKFDGLPLAALLKAVGATGRVLKAVALNDYLSTMPIAETVGAGAFMAVRQNGEPMAVRDRGPLWIVFPYDTDPRLITDAYLNRSVWQLKELIVE